jgi:soluble lytic murein transglycosylase-like protein
LKNIIKNIFGILAILAFSINTAIASNVETVKQCIITQAKAMNVEPAIVLSIAKTESGFNQAARGAGGHIGVFQLSNATAKTMGINPYNLDENIKGGILYYKNMYDMFGSMELAVAAYNSGPVAIKRCNNTIPKHSQQFVTRIMSDYKSYKNSGL